jgi:hypothetical protein
MTPTDLAQHLTRFLGQYLPAIRAMSPNTIRAYRDTFMLLLRYCRDIRGFAPERLQLEQINAALISDFLKYLQEERQCGKSTRNQRLVLPIRPDRRTPAIAPVPANIGHSNPALCTTYGEVPSTGRLKNDSGPT